jgi:2-polyprenyl-6-methoxyphenol hydroxylase-like FAD-dependent oxidoreductase
VAAKGRILIAGAGIGGLTTAIALRRAGCDVEVFERARELRPVGAGIVLAMNALVGLRSLGVYEPVSSAGVPIRSAAILTARGRALGVTDFAPLAKDFGVAAIAYHRAELHQALLAEAGDVVRLGAQVTTFDQDGDGVRVTLSDGRVVSGDALVGADGLNSNVRRKLLGEEPPRYSGYTSWRAIAPSSGLLEEGVTTESWGAGRRFGMVGLGGGRVYWFAVDDAPEGGKDQGGARQHLLRLFEGWHDPIRSLLEATPEESILRTDIQDRDPVRVWGEGRVTLLGDAAHPMTPNMGQGACQAVEDAVVLADEVARAEKLEASFRRYEARRQGRTAAVVVQSRRFGEIAQWSNPLARWFRNAAMWALPTTATVRQLRRFLADAPVYRGGAEGDVTGDTAGSERAP